MTSMHLTAILVHIRYSHHVKMEPGMRLCMKQPQLVHCMPIITLLHGLVGTSVFLSQT